MNIPKYSKTVHLKGSVLYDESIERIYEVYRTPKYVSEIQKEFLSKAEKISGPGQFYDDIGTIFYLECKNGIKSEFIVEDSFKTKNHKMFQFFSYKIGNFDLQYRMKFSFHWCSDTFRTLFVQELWYFFERQLMIPHSQGDYDLELEVKSKLVKEYLNKNNYSNQVESILIKTNFHKVCETICDWEQFAHRVPRVADRVITEIETTHNTIKAKTMSIVFRNFNYKLKVFHQSITDVRMQLYLEVVDSSPKIPAQELRFTIIKISDVLCLVHFRHIFKENLKRTNINKIQAEKRLILSELKESLEKDSYHIENQEFVNNNQSLW